MITHADGGSLADHPAVGSGRADGLAVVASGVAGAPRAPPRRGRPGNGPSRLVVRRRAGQLTPLPPTPGLRWPEIFRSGVPVVTIAIIVIVVSSCCSLLYVVLTYNRLVRTRNQIDNAYSQIDVQLKRRHDLIPNLVETVKGYAAHEKSTFEAVTAARANAINAQQGSSPAEQAAGRERAQRRAEVAVRGRRGVPGPQGEPELPEPAGGADLHRGPHRLRAAVLQRQRPGLQQPDPVVPRQPPRRHVQLRQARVLRGRPRGNGPGQGPVLGPSGP